MKIGYFFDIETDEDAQRLADFVATFRAPTGALIPEEVKAFIIAEETEDEPKKPTRRRNRLAEETKPEASESSDEETGTGAEKPHRRKRSSKGKGGEDTVSSSPRRRSRTAKETDKISDADLSKAASEGAAALTPKVVMKLLEDTFDVSDVKKLDGDQRRHFVDLIHEMIEANE
ncbi:hypothetical protein LCGC14_0610290 [marine sediment metagenome]|uniref:Uncharacterized protein n=1 Tax=marine sediment metagenome TaxID=412755 RepID=A0A0F9R7V7_9ZZZZ